MTSPMTLGINITHRLAGLRNRHPVTRAGLAMLIASTLVTPGMAGDRDGATNRHAALVTALRSLDSDNMTEAARAQAILLSVSPRGIDEEDNPASELVEAYDLDALDMPPSRGHMRGPVMRSGQLNAPVEEMSLVFEGGERADVTLYAQGDRTLEVLASETVLCRTQAEDGVAHCSWMPMFSKSHTIRIVREDTQSLPYTLIVN